MANLEAREGLHAIPQTKECITSGCRSSHGSGVYWLNKQCPWKYALISVVVHCCNRILFAPSICDGAKERNSSAHVAYRVDRLSVSHMKRGRERKGWNAHSPDRGSAILLQQSMVVNLLAPCATAAMLVVLLIWQKLRFWWDQDAQETILFFGCAERLIVGFTKNNQVKD